MPDPSMTIDRRTVLQSVTALAIAQVLTGTARAAGRAATGGFAFLTGEWRIANRMKQGESWIEFPGEATVHSLLGGNASIEELRIPRATSAGSASGSTIRPPASGTTIG